jgi:hypothetical protein
VFARAPTFPTACGTLRPEDLINVETSKGLVQLSGFVSSRTDIDSAMRLASNIDGVNEMQLRKASCADAEHSFHQAEKTMNRIPEFSYTALRRAAALMAGLVLVGCASTPPVPTANLQAAQLAISSAERVEAGQYAAGELSAARTKLASADGAVTEKKMVLAAQFADEARAEAELASARTAVSKANAVNDEMKRGTGTLVEEMKRGTGDKQ